MTLEIRLGPRPRAGTGTWDAFANSASRKGSGRGAGAGMAGIAGSDSVITGAGATKLWRPSSTCRA